MRVLLNVALFLGTAAAMIVGIGSRTGNAVEPDDSLAYLLQHKDEYDVAFAGSSMTGYMIDPVVFDGEMAKRGYATNSFNFGTGGSLAHETNYRIRRFLGSRPARLRFIFIESLEFRAYIDETAAETDRFAVWHDLEEAGLVILAALKHPFLKPSERWYLLRKHLSGLMNHYAVIGTGAKLMPGAAGQGAAKSRRPEPAKEIPDFGTSKGYESLVQLAKRGYGGFLASQHARFEAGRDGYHRQLELRRQWFESPPELATEGFDFISVTAQVRAVTARGVEPIYLAPPAFHHQAGYPRALAQSGRISHIIFMDNPLEYPGLFEPGARHDKLHLADEAAREYSRLIAQQFAQLLERNPALASKLRRAKP